MMGEQQSQKVVRIKGKKYWFSKSWLAYTSWYLVAIKKKKKKDLFSGLREKHGAQIRK